MVSMITGLCTWLFFELYGTSIPSILPGVVVGMLSMISVSIFYPDKYQK
jgi:hypothetical protein